MIKKAGEPIEIEESEPIPETSEEDIEKSFDMFIGFGLMLGNPSLVKRGIEPLRTEEIQNLIDAIVKVSSSKIAEAGEQLAEKIEKVKILGKILIIAAAFYPILEPRYNSIKKAWNDWRAKKKEVV